MSQKNDILIVFPLIRRKMSFRKVVGAAAFLLWESTDETRLGQLLNLLRYFTHT